MSAVHPARPAPEVLAVCVSAVELGDPCPSLLQRRARSAIHRCRAVHAANFAPRDNRSITPRGPRGHGRSLAPQRAQSTLRRRLGAAVRAGTRATAAAVGPLALALGCLVGPAFASHRVVAPDVAQTSVYTARHAHGLMVTTGGWPYCKQARPIARKTGYTLVCGRYYKDGYTGPGLRLQRHQDWGDQRYLARFSQKIRTLHRRIGGRLLMIGASYAGYGVATLASHHPEIHPDRVIVIDSYLDLVARRQHLPNTHVTAREIDEETGGSEPALRERSPSVSGLVRLLKNGTRLTVVWTVSERERVHYHGATCDRTANAGVLSSLAVRLQRPVVGWVTVNKHGHDLWHHGVEIVRGKMPGRRVPFRPDGRIPPESVCE